MTAGRPARGRFAGAALAITVALGCASPSGVSKSVAPSPQNDQPMSSTAADPGDSADPTDTADPTASSDPTQPPTATDPVQASTSSDGTKPPSPPKEVVFTKDHHYYSSPWYDGAWQEMIGFGCTNAPYYSRDLSCPRSRPGKHHGIDTFMPCGTKVRAAVKGRVVPNPALGAAYGKHGLKIRHKKFDFVIGHARKLKVKPGQHVEKGQLVARSGKSGAPDGCHLHFEKRPAGGGYLSAVDPLRSLRRTVVHFSDD